MTEYVDGMLGRMYDLQCKGACCDVKIRVEDEVFPCHKIVLCAGAEYFEKMFLGDFKESTEDTVTLQNVSKTVFSTLLKFMYTGELIQSTNAVMEVAAAARYFGVKELEKACTDYVLGRRNKYNAVSLYLDSIKTRFGNIEESFFKYIRENIEILTDDEVFYRIPYKQFRALISGKRNEHILNVIVKWITYKPKSRAKFAARLLGGMRLQFLEHKDPVLGVIKMAASVSKVKIKPTGCGYCGGEPGITIFGIDKITNSIVPQRYVESATPPRSFVEGSIEPIHYLANGLTPKECVEFSVVKFKHYSYICARTEQEFSLSMFDNVFGDSWTPLKPLIGYCHKLISYDRGDCIYGIGGRYRQGVIDHIENYVPELDKWYPVGLPDAFSEMDLIAHNGLIYLFGNNVAGELCYRTFDPRSGVWANVNVHRFKMVSHNASAILNNKIYISGELDSVFLETFGRTYKLTGPMSKYSIVSYDTLSGAYDLEPRMYHERSRWSGYNLISNKGKLFAIGGNPAIEVYEPYFLDSWYTDVRMDEHMINIRAIV